MKRCILLIILLLVAGCAANLNLVPDEPQKVFPQPDEKPRVQDINGVKIVTMTARQWEFIPDRIVVEKGDKVRVQVVSEDILHGISIPHFGIERRLEPGDEVIFEFTADEVGEYEFHSHIYSGIGFQDMKGKIIVR